MSPAAEPAESAAQRARTVLTTAVSARLSTAAGQVDLLGGHVALPGGRLVLLVSPHGVVAAAVAGADVVAARLVVVDVAPVAVRDRERARLEVAGTLAPAGAEHASLAWQALRGEEGGPDDAIAVELVPGTVVLAADGRHVGVDVEAFRAAEPDPVAPAEAALLQHLAHAHRGSLDLLAGVASGRPVEPGTRVAPLRMTAHALTLRLSGAVGDRDVVLPFARPVSDPRHADRAVAELVLAGQRG